LVHAVDRTGEHDIGSWLTFDRSRTPDEAAALIGKLSPTGVLLAVRLANGTTAKIVMTPGSGTSVQELASRAVKRFRASAFPAPSDPAMVRDGAANVAGVMSTGSARELVRVVDDQRCSIYSASVASESTHPVLAPTIDS
jgi:hypothetical protein